MEEELTGNKTFPTRVGAYEDLKHKWLDCGDLNTHFIRNEQKALRHESTYLINRPNTTCNQSMERREIVN